MFKWLRKNKIFKSNNYDIETNNHVTLPNKEDNEEKEIDENIEQEVEKNDISINCAGEVTNAPESWGSNMNFSNCHGNFGNVNSSISGSVNGSFCSSSNEMFKYDVKGTKNIDCRDVNKVEIDCYLGNLELSVSDEDSAEITFEGNIVMSESPIVDAYKKNGVLKIVAKQTDAGPYSGQVNIFATIPNKVFDIILANAVSGDITFYEGVVANTIKIKTTSGDSTCYASFLKGIFNAVSGDIVVVNYANQDVAMNIKTVSGDVEVNLENIANIELSTSTVSGDCDNYHDEESGYTADIDISTVSGDIVIN